MPSHDFITDLLEKLDSQEFKYYLTIIDVDKKTENDNIFIYTNLKKTEVNKMIKAINDNNKKK